MDRKRRMLVSGALMAPVINALPGSVLAGSSRIQDDRFDPWIEVSRSALEHNVRAVAKLGEGRPILAVVKNNSYGLGLALVAEVLDKLPQVSGLAVINAAEAHELRDAGIRKPILLLGEFAPGDGPDLAGRRWNSNRACGKNRRPTTDCAVLSRYGSRSHGDSIPSRDECY